MKSLVEAMARLEGVVREDKDRDAQIVKALDALSARMPAPSDHKPIIDALGRLEAATRLGQLEAATRQAPPAVNSEHIAKAIAAANTPLLKAVTLLSASVDALRAEMHAGKSPKRVRIGRDAHGNLTAIVGAVDDAKAH
jgi:hypothetical protein